MPVALEKQLPEVSMDADGPSTGPALVVPAG
jgi:hypothetical protein